MDSGTSFIGLMAFKKKNPPSERMGKFITNSEFTCGEMSLRISENAAKSST
jgi:hypothetical protein